jgi:hypothetical protein
MAARQSSTPIEPVTETIFTTQSNDRLLDIYFSHMQLQSQFAQQAGPSHHHAPFLSVNLTGYNHFHQPQPTKPVPNRKPQRVEIEQKKDGSFLQYSFFIFEESSDKELDTEEDRMEEKLLYFYPDFAEEELNNARIIVPKNNETALGSIKKRSNSITKVPKAPKQPIVTTGKKKPVKKEEQLMIVGFVQAYVYFCRHFEPSNKEVELIRFKKSKMGVRKVGDLYMCLCAPLSTPDGSLRTQCQRIFDMITFFHGPLNHIKDRMESRAEYELYIKQLGSELAPLVRAFVDKPSSFFDPVPYTELPPVRFTKYSN